MDGLKRLFGMEQTSRERLPGLAIEAVRRIKPAANVEVNGSAYGIIVDGRPFDLEALLSHYNAEPMEHRYPLVDAWARSLGI